MGNSLSRIGDFLGLKKEEVRILMVGLSASGKTSILYHLKLAEFVTTTPTVGFNVDMVLVNDIHLTVWDIGGQRTTRTMWHHYCENTKGIIFVVDSTDDTRLCEATAELHGLLGRPEMKDMVLLILANKQDLPNAKTINELIYEMNLNSIDQTWYIEGTSAKTGKGIRKGLEILQTVLVTQKRFSKIGFLSRFMRM